MVRDNRHASASIFGAIYLERGHGAAMITPAANTEAMDLHRAEISTQVTPGAVAVVLCDQAEWHQRTKRLQVPDHIRLLPLPAYAPELNSMKNPWQYFRCDKLCALVCDTYEDIVEACRQACLFVINDPATHPVHQMSRLGMCQCLGRLVLSPAIRYPDRNRSPRTMTYLVADDLPTVPAGERFRALLARPGILQLPGAHNGQA